MGKEEARAEGRLRNWSLEVSPDKQSSLHDLQLMEDGHGVCLVYTSVPWLELSLSQIKTQKCKLLLLTV